MLLHPFWPKTDFFCILPSHEINLLGDPWLLLGIGWPAPESHNCDFLSSAAQSTSEPENSLIEFIECIPLYVLLHIALRIESVLRRQLGAKRCLKENVQNDHGSTLGSWLKIGDMIRREVRRTRFDARNKIEVPICPPKK
jgi:hypothetical protein